MCNNALNLNKLVATDQLQEFVDHSNLALSFQLWRRVSSWNTPQHRRPQIPSWQTHNQVRDELQRLIHLNLSALLQDQGAWPASLLMLHLWLYCLPGLQDSHILFVFWQVLASTTWWRWHRKLCVHPSVIAEVEMLPQGNDTSPKVFADICAWSTICHWCSQSSVRQKWYLFLSYATQRCICEGWFNWYGRNALLHVQAQQPGSWCSKCGQAAYTTQCQDVQSQGSLKANLQPLFALAWESVAKWDPACSGDSKWCMMTSLYMHAELGSACCQSCWRQTQLTGTWCKQSRCYRSWSETKSQCCATDAWDKSAVADIRSPAPPFGVQDCCFCHILGCLCRLHMHQTVFMQADESDINPPRLSDFNPTRLSFFVASLLLDNQMQQQELLTVDSTVEHFVIEQELLENTVKYRSQRCPLQGAFAPAAADGKDRVDKQNFFKLMLTWR